VMARCTGSTSSTNCCPSQLFPSLKVGGGVSRVKRRQAALS
jgi:hypothetical protein